MTNTKMVGNKIIDVATRFRNELLDLGLQPVDVFHFFASEAAVIAVAFGRPKEEFVEIMVHRFDETLKVYREKIQ